MQLKINKKQLKLGRVQPVDSIQFVVREEEKDI